MRRSCPDLAHALLALVLLLATPATALDLDVALATSRAAVGHTIGDYAFTDRQGKRVRLADYRGKPLLVSFVYTGCGEVCPTATRFLAGAVDKARDAVGSDVFNVVTIGFNQPFDDPQALDGFARKQGIDSPRWNFLAPDAGRVDALTRDFGFSYGQNAGGFDHLAQVSIVDAEGRLYRQIRGETFAPAMLVAPLRALVTGGPAPARNLTDLLEQVRVLCTVYDPRTGRYRLDYGLFIEIFAGLTFLAGTAMYVGSEWRRQRRATSVDTHA
jgi:protein SCO1/2